MQEERLIYYPGLSWESWVYALLTVQPDLWVTQETAHLDQQGLQRMTRCLYSYLQTDVVQHRVLGPRSPYFAQQLVNRQDDAIDALAEIEAAPSACGPAVYGLVTGLAAGDIAALLVYQATEPGPHERPRNADRARARAAVPGRLQALREARGEPTGN
ncbi:hypothetical protein [Hymenobacter norwichensis]|uniref:hypothetical protein n=1 Tax=Hymenobacter norwichensis TaxID=223903 RepID=UPI000426E391|nr:hypothetical protein [Hymenobacter norwichensis]